MSVSFCSIIEAESSSHSTSTESLDSSVLNSDTSASVTSESRNFLTVNVGGSRYKLSQELLLAYPETRLGKLAGGDQDVALDLCDDADLSENEFFFDRNSQTFQYVINFYRTGYLHVSEELCEISFLQEMQYWGLDELRIQSCCRERYYRRKDQKETLDVHRDLEANDTSREEDFTGSTCAALRQRLWNLLEKPESSRAAQTFGSLSLFFVVLSVISMVLVSLDSGEDFGFADLGPGVPQLLDGLEYTCVVWFTCELLLRFLCVRDKCRFCRRIPNVIDLLAILPFYVTLVMENVHGESTELENMGRVVQVLRLLRSLRMLKLGRHSTGLKSLGVTIAQCYEEIGLLLLFLSVGISIFAMVVYALEHDLPYTTFTSVPAAWWWATTSMTTVGYGDIRPDTAAGKVLGFLCILSGILVLALPIAIINDRFSTCYLNMKVKEAAVRHGEVMKRLARGSTGETVDEDEGAGSRRGFGGGVNLRDAYARRILEMLKLHSGERVSTRKGGGGELWW